MTIRVKELSGLGKVKGLLGTKIAAPILIKTRWGIHTLGMRYPIDVIVLDSQNRVVKMKENLVPNRIFLWHPRYNHVVELPAGFIAKNNIKIGERVTLLAIS